MTTLRIAYASNGARLYYDSSNQLVAVATGNLGNTSFTHYFCLPDIRGQDSQTTWATPDQLQAIANSQVPQTWQFQND